MLGALSKFNNIEEGLFHAHFNYELQILSLNSGLQPGPFLETIWWSCLAGGSAADIWKGEASGAVTYPTTHRVALTGKNFLG